LPQWGSTNVYLGSASTGGAAQFMCVNGPVRNEWGMNSSFNVFGPGNRANATLGRSLRLILMNALAMTPGVFDMAIQGQPAKYGYCIAENEEESPWEPLHVEMGLPPGSSAVTVVSVKAGVQVDERNTQAPEGILSTIANAILRVPGSTGQWVVVMGTEHSDFIGRRAGWSKQQVKEFLSEQTRRPLAAGAPRRGNVRSVDGVDYVYAFRDPGDIILIVAGGPNGGMTTIIPTFVYGSVPPSKYATARIRRVGE
jgi:hypothetical protein